jgi:anti-sigma regulatory factor (Ser/Thr protein kinase)
MPTSAPLHWDVVVDIQAEARYARVARTAAAACAVLEGFDVDQLSDLRLLVDEVFAAMVEGGARRIELRLALAGGRVEMELTGHRGRASDRHPADAGFVHTLAGVLGTDVVVELDRDPQRFAATMAAV